MNRLHPAHRVLVYAVLLVLILSGALWEADVARSALIKVHGAAAMASLLVLGSLLARHVATGWSAKANRASGACLLVVLSWLVISGYLLYYVGDETLRRYAAQSHFWTGLALAALFAAHQRARARASRGA
ncbi:MAG: hypothetical protein ABR570_05710 [Burkholderiales bacterium]